MVRSEVVVVGGAEGDEEEEEEDEVHLVGLWVLEIGGLTFLYCRNLVSVRSLLFSTSVSISFLDTSINICGPGIQKYPDTDRQYTYPPPPAMSARSVRAAVMSETTTALTSRGKGK